MKLLTNINAHITKIVGLLMSILFLASCSDRWNAFVYADKTNLNSIATARLGPFKSLEECRANAKARLYEFSKQTIPEIEGDYECGKNCDDGSKLGGIAICEETVR